jgi:hypothetical protein
VQRADIDAAAAAIILGRWLTAQAIGGLSGKNDRGGSDGMDGSA